MSSSPEQERETPNNAYLIPPLGADDWHLPLNTNFEKLDRDIEIRDRNSKRTEYQPKSGAKYLATDTEDEYIGTGDTWRPLRTSGFHPAFKTVTAQSQSNILYAAHFPGSDLAAKVSNALESLVNGYGKILVTPKYDGTPWEWPRPIQTTLPTNGLEIECLANTPIHITTTDWPLSITGDEEHSASNPFTLTGGNWHIQTDTPGWIQLTDIPTATISPTTVTNITNPSQTATGIQLRNERTETRNVTVENCTLSNVDIGIDHIPASVTGGAGSNTFDDESLDDITLDDVSTTGVRFRNGCRITGSSFTDVSVIASGDAVTAWVLDCRAHATAIKRPTITADGGTTLTAFKIRHTDENPVRVYDPHLEGVDKKVDATEPSQQLILVNEGGELRFAKFFGSQESTLHLQEDSIKMESAIQPDFSEDPEDPDNNLDPESGWLHVETDDGERTPLPYRP